jgi:hypothetical protein
MKEYLPEMGFDVLPAFLGRGATFHDKCSMGFTLVP